VEWFRPRRQSGLSSAVLPSRHPGSGPHVPVDRHAPLSEFERIAEQFPVFRIAEPDAPEPG